MMTQAKLSDQQIKDLVLHDVAELNAHLRLAAEHGLTIEVAEESLQMVTMTHAAPQIGVLLTRVERI